MTADLREGLEAVVGLAEKATAGEWSAAPNFDGRVLVRCGAEFVRTNADYFMVPENDAAAIAACVNLIRQHGPALLALARDGERLDWLGADDNCDRFYPVGGTSNDRRWYDADTKTHHPTLRAAIDAALSQPGAGAE